MNKRTFLMLLSLPAFVSLAGPAGVARAQPPGDDAVSISYAVPAEGPTGEIQVLSLGVADLPRPSLIGTERFVHIRLAAHNQYDPEPWVLDAREQVLDLPDGSSLPPRFAESSEGGAAYLSLPAGARGYLDLFFTLQDGFDPTWTSLTWRLRRSTTVVW